MREQVIKFLVIFLIFISNLHASEMRWKTVEDIDLSESFMDEYNDCLFSVERFRLKNNYSLIIRPVLEYENGNQFVYTQVYLQSDDTLLLILDNEDGVSLFHGAKKYLFRYENIDFDNYFCLVRYDGAYYYYLFDKRNGKMLLRCLKCSVDLDNNIMIYLDESDEMILYDLDSNEQYKIDKYIVYGKYGSNTYWEKFKVMDVTEHDYVISFYGNYDKNGEEIIQLITIPRRKESRNHEPILN